MATGKKQNQVTGQGEQVKQETEDQAKDQEVEQKDPEKNEPVKRDVWIIAQGYSQTSKIGVLVAGAEVRPDFFKGGKETFDRLVEKKVIVRK